MLTGSSISEKSWKEDEEEVDNSLYDEAQIQWSDCIFIPFNPLFQFLVLLCVLHKTFLGPLDGCFNITMCSSVFDYNIITQGIRYFYMVFANGIYFLDTFLHIVHRQVTDKAVRREHLPKSAVLILIDVLSLIPFDELLAPDTCVITFWPHIMSFLEFIIIYRVVEYFELTNTHTCWKLYAGYTLTIILCVNFLTCMMLLLTFHGLCADCKGTEYFYDWRNFLFYFQNESVSDKFAWYFYGYQYVMSYIIHHVFNETKPSTLLEFGIACALMCCGCILDIVLLLPKLFSEAILSLRWISTFHPHVDKLIQETKRRNPSPTAHVSVRNFYNLMWTQRVGIINIPHILTELPRYLRIDIQQDMIWPVFFHSPTLRKTSSPYKRFISDLIRLDYKLPGARFFAGPHSNTHLYYLKSGIVQLISTDDGSTPLLSVSGGTLFGDISFIIPPLKRKIKVKCLTYCEVLYITRSDLLRSLHRYPDDRKNVFQLAKDKMQHAKTLYSCKQNVKGLDRAEDEGLDWVKRRWWEISDCVDSYKKKSKLSQKCEMPSEETFYHCAKYLGQLVLCNDSQLKKSSLFVNDKFPWVLARNTTFSHIWHFIIVMVVIFVLITYPPNLCKTQLPPWFLNMQYFSDFFYIADIFVSLSTSVNTDEYGASDFASVMLVRFKKPSFVLDVLAALWIEIISIWVGSPQYYYVCQFNRLIKIYILFDSSGRNWSIGQDHIFPVYVRIILSYFSYLYITAFVTFLMIRYYPIFSPSYFFGTFHCDDNNLSERDCAFKSLESVIVATQFVFEYTYSEVQPNTMIDIAVYMIICYHGYLIAMYCKSIFIAGMYLKFRDRVNYQRFVTTLRSYYRHHTIHKNLMLRLERYLECHWKHHHGVDVLNPNKLKDEPYDIFWKVQGEVAEKIIGESDAFYDADPSLVRELAYIAKFLIMPQNATMFLFGVICKNITWIVRGYVKCEYHNEKGDVLKRFYGPGDMISMTPVLLGKPSIRTYVAYTDCEIIHIRVTDFNNIMKRYPHEWVYLTNTIKEFTSQFDEIYDNYIIKHSDYLQKIREKVFDAKKFSDRSQTAIVQNTGKIETKKKPPEQAELYVSPDSSLMKFWMVFRALTVLISIVTVALLGGGGVFYRWYLNFLVTICDAISLMDIVLKFFLAYYDERGILITSRQKTMAHYLTRGFCMDVIGCVPWDHVLQMLLSRELDEGSLNLINTTARFAHLYILTGFLDYLADRPSSISAIIKIAKWQVITLLLTLAGSHFLITNCINFTFDNDDNLVNMTRLDTCWLPSYMTIDDRPTNDQLKMLFAHSINLAQSGLLGMNLGKFRIREKGNILVAINLFVLGVVNWFVVAYSLTLLVLISRSDTLFQHGVRQLQTFLTAERVEKKLIKRAVAHFSYWWIRTKGINIHTLIFDRMGVIFRQDLSYYFYKATYASLDTLLGGGEQFQRQLSSQSSQLYFIPREEIMREMDLMPYIYVVHRGRVIISQNEEKITILTKGAIFGQLSGTVPRPVKVSVTADGYTDVLQMSIKHFDEVLTDKIRENIKNNPQSRNDFMATKKAQPENPYNTVRYILRGRKTIKLPWMTVAREAHRGNWYSRWLFIACLYGPAATAYMTFILFILPPGGASIFLSTTFIVFDLVHLAHTISEYFNLEVTVIGDKCMNVKIGPRLFRSWKFYVNIFSLVVPVVTLIFDHWIYYQISRLARLHLLYEFHKHLCKTFKSQWSSISLKFIILTLLLHSMTCGWIYFGCRGGCARITRSFFDEHGSRRVSFVTPKHWSSDYIVALTFIVLLQTHTTLNTVMQVNTTQIYYKIVINFILCLTNIWLMSVAVGAIYTRFRELYQYDFSVRTLNIYLQHSGLSPSLIRSVVEYTNHLWHRQRGNWLPELAHQAPDCLREDILSALYLYHILTPPLFRQLPEYFTRQLVARVGRVVVFPGKCIVQEGDIVATMYFIHEGEVEKWYNFFSPEKKLASLLTTNGYFGFVPGLFPNTRFQYTYYTRTVVDLVYLRLKEWQDLLNAYPDIKMNLYQSAKHLKSREFKKDGVPSQKDF
ncbi:uncharacterized protein LOC106129229 [Amyelois transitella]|uniref:uncharacterized protein LOC106129229 n=1 Tax=Amyelois transitella TaxID=680683 RepID=UPI00298F87AA|nr:uncharacterized protein LOC106129229 [Amyelois transitella]